MYYGSDYYFVLNHPSKERWPEEKPMPCSQFFLCLLVFSLSIGIFLDWQWFWGKLEERERNFIPPGTAAYNQIVKEIFSEIGLVRQKAEAGTLTLGEAVVAQYRIIELSDKIEHDFTSQSSFIIDKARDCFIKNWQPPEEDSVKIKFYAENKSDRDAQAKFAFRWNLTQAQAKTPQPDCMRIDIDWSAVGLWFLKWYYLLVFPSFFCLLLNIWFDKKSFRMVIEKIYFDCREIFYAGCFGPLGLIFVSETANSFRRYRKVLQEFLETKEIGYRPTALEEKAIWAKVMAPVISFEDAIKKAERELVYRPALAGFAVWILGSFSLSAKSQTLKPVIFVSSQTDQTDSENEVLELSGGVSFKDVFSSFELPKIEKINLCFIGIEPVIFQAPDFIMSEASEKKVSNREFLSVVYPRAPPKEARDIFISSPAACAA
jgi:hypothetical protein